MVVEAFDHIVLRVQDLDRALAFYRDVLGLEVLGLEEHREGKRPFVSVRIGHQLLDLVPDPTFQRAAVAPENGFLHFCMRVRGKVTDWIPELRQHGIALLEEQPAWRMGAAGWGWSIYVQDPDGYIVELKESGL